MNTSDRLQKRIEELEKELAEIRKADWGKSKSIFVVAQDLRRTFFPLKGFLETLLQDENEDWYTREDRRDFYTILLENVDRQAYLVDNLLSGTGVTKYQFANLVDKDSDKIRSAMKWQKGVMVRPIIERVVKDEQARTDKHQLTFNMGSGHIAIETDPELFEKMLPPVIEWAIKASPNGGAIEISARLEAPGKDGALLLQVRDYGVGLPKDYKEESQRVGLVFTSPASASRRPANYQPTGIYLTSQAALAHHGKFDCDSEGPDLGCTYSIRLPVKQCKRFYARLNAGHTRSTKLYSFTGGSVRRYSSRCRPILDKGSG